MKKLITLLILSLLINVSPVYAQDDSDQGIPPETRFLGISIGGGALIGCLTFGTAAGTFSLGAGFLPACGIGALVGAGIGGGGAAAITVSKPELVPFQSTQQTENQPKASDNQPPQKPAQPGQEPAQPPADQTSQQPPTQATCKMLNDGFHAQNLLPDNQYTFYRIAYGREGIPNKDKTHIGIKPDQNRSIFLSYNNELNPKLYSRYVVSLTLNDQPACPAITINLPEPPQSKEQTPESVQVSCSITQNSDNATMTINLPNIPKNSSYTVVSGSQTLVESASLVHSETIIARTAILSAGSHHIITKNASGEVFCDKLVEIKAKGAGPAAGITLPVVTQPTAPAPKPVVAQNSILTLHIDRKETPEVESAPEGQYYTGEIVSIGALLYGEGDVISNPADYCFPTPSTDLVFKINGQIIPESVGHTKACQPFEFKMFAAAARQEITVEFPGQPDLKENKDIASFELIPRPNSKEPPVQPPDKENLTRVVRVTIDNELLWTEDQNFYFPNLAVPENGGTFLLNVYYADGESKPYYVIFQRPQRTPTQPNLPQPPSEQPPSEQPPAGQPTTPQGPVPPPITQKCTSPVEFTNFIRCVGPGQALWSCNSDPSKQIEDASHAGQCLCNKDSYPDEFTEYRGCDTNLCGYEYWECPIPGINKLERFPTPAGGSCGQTYGNNACVSHSPSQPSQPNPQVPPAGDQCPGGCHKENDGLCWRGPVGKVDDQCPPGYQNEDDPNTGCWGLCQ